MNLIASYVISFLIIFIVPVFVYGIFVALFKIKEPAKKGKFFFGVFIEKAGTTIAFVTLYFLGKPIFSGQWFIYSLVWFAMFSLTEIGQIFVLNSSKKEAVAGIISEAIYFPLSAFIISIL